MRALRDLSLLTDPRAPSQVPLIKCNKGVATCLCVVLGGRGLLVCGLRGSQPAYAPSGIRAPRRSSPIPARPLRCSK